MPAKQKSKSKTKSKSAGNIFNSMNVTKAEKNKRRIFLTKRINDLFDTLEEWLAGTEYTLMQTSIALDDLKLPGAEIKSGNDVIISLKPAGLWAFGVNCRIDISSRFGSLILFDVADETKPADWELIYNEMGKGTKKLTKMIFRNLLKKINPKLKLVK